MKRTLVSDLHTGKHPNAVSGAERVGAHGTPLSQGVNVGRTHESRGAERVLDSPPFVAKPTCGVTRKDGKVCPNPSADGQPCFGHRTGNGGRDNG